MGQAPVIDIRELRLNRGLSVPEAAQRMKLPAQTLFRAETGESVPQPRNAFKIAQFYGHKVTDIWPLPKDGPAGDDVGTTDEEEAA